MKKKHFWIGFGTGVIFAALILGVSCLIRTSDSEVISRAKKLGMVFEKSNEIVVKTSEPEITDAPTPEADAKKATVTALPPENTAAPTAESSDFSDNQNDTKPVANNNDEVLQKEKEKMEKDIKESSTNLKIKAGDISSTVSDRLESMGIIKNSKKFDTYLRKNGYSNSISAGSYKVSMDDTYEELAKKITRK